MILFSTKQNRKIISICLEDKDVDTTLKDKKQGEEREMNHVRVSNTCSISCGFAPIPHRVRAAVHYRPLPQSDPLRSIRTV